MPWKRKKLKGSALGGYPIDLPSIPPKKEFKTMLELLVDAESYDIKSEEKVRDALLTSLCDYIECFKLKKKGNG